MMQQYDKMILAILQGDDYHDAVHSLNEHGFYATVLNSSGGFLKKRSVTLMIGLESARLDEALAILKKHGERTEMRYEAPVLSPEHAADPAFHRAAGDPDALRRRCAVRAGRRAERALLSMELRCTAERETHLLSILRRELQLSSTLVRRLKYCGAYTVNGEPAHTDRPVRPGDVVRVCLDEPRPDYPAEDGRFPSSMRMRPCSRSTSRRGCSCIRRFPARPHAGQPPARLL